MFAAQGNPTELARQADLAGTDWRDVLMNGGLADSDWMSILDRELGVTSDGFKMQSMSDSFSHDMQAARGASLSSLGEPGSTPRSAVGLFAAVAVVVFALDQITKVLAVQFLEGESSVGVIPGLIQLTFLRNPGAALGTGSSMTIGLTIVAIAVSVGVVRVATRLRDRWWAVGLGLLLAGATGNLADRLFRAPAPLRGRVVDFIDYGPFVGNVADIALTVAAALIIWRTFRGVGINGEREQR